MGAVVDLVEDVVGGVVDVVEDVVGIVGDAIDWVVDEIVDPVLSGVGDIIDAALDDPIALVPLAEPRKPPASAACKFCPARFLNAACSAAAVS